MCKSHIISCNENVDARDIARNVLNEYATKAKLVITSRLHCIASCLAMGIPVIAVVENCSLRYSYIERLVKIYTRDDLQRKYKNKNLYSRYFCSRIIL